MFLARVEWLPVTSRSHGRHITDKCKISIMMIYVGLNFNSSQAHGQKTRGTNCAMTNGLTSHLVNCNCVILSTNIYSQHVTAR